MKKTELLFSILLIISIHSYAQVNKNYDGVKPEVQKGAKSLVFTYTPFQSSLGASPSASLLPVDLASGSDPTPIQLGGVGLKYFVSDNISLLGSIGFGSASVTDEINTDEKAEASTTMFGISVDADYHLPLLYSVAPYVGANISIGSYSIEETLMDNGDTEKVESSSSSFGIGISFGFDWYFTEGLSLGGKYTLNYINYAEPERTYSNNSYSNTQKGPGTSAFGTGIGTIVLNVHF